MMRIMFFISLVTRQNVALSFATQHAMPQEFGRKGRGRKGFNKERSGFLPSAYHKKVIVI